MNSTPDPSGWHGDEGTVPGLPVHKPQPPAQPANEWRGEEGTLAGMPVAKHTPHEQQHTNAEWRGEEGTLAGMPVAQHTSPAQQPPGTAWRGEEGTLAGMPVAGAQRSQPTESPAGAWRGEEGTLAGMPVAGSPRPPAAQPSEWRGEEGTLAGMPAVPRTLPAGVQEWRGDEGTIPGLPGRQPVRTLKSDNDATPRTAVAGDGTPRIRPRDADATPRTPALAGSLPPRAADSTDDWHLQGRTGELSGQSFGDYEIGRILGEGGMGIIYRARQRSLSRRVAVKTLSSAYAQDPVQRARFEIEARAASLIQSPHVVAVYAAGSYNDIIYFVMEYVEGNHLGNVIAERARTGRGLDPPVALEYILQSARGLSTAASHGIVHRDIKPSNLLITKDGVVKIADFGISKIAGESNLTRTGTAVGTPSYISPEQGRGEATDVRSDLYSLGVVLYEALTGQKPFTGDNADAIIYQHNYAEPKALRTIDPTIPETYQAVVVRCLQKDPAKRYQTADELIADFERIKAGDVSVTAMLQARYGTGAEDAMRRRLGRRQRWILPLAAGLLLLSGIGGGFWWWSSQREERNQQREAVDKLRERLRTTLDAPIRVPPSSGPDLEAMTRFVGTADPDIVRWQTKITSVGTLQGRLARLDGRDLPGPELRSQSATDLTALAELVGPDNPEQVRWRARLAEAVGEIASLRKRLAELDDNPDATIAQRDRLSPALAQLITLAGPEDSDAARWKRRIEALDNRVAELNTSLTPLLDANAVHTEMRLAEFKSILDELRLRHGTAPAGPTETKAREAMSRQAAEINRLRGVLGRLDEVEIPTASTLRRSEPDLAAYRLRVSPDDPQLMRWEQKADTVRRRIAELEERSAVLQRGSELSKADLIAAGEALDALRPLMEAETQVTRDRANALRNAHGALARWEDDLKPLQSPDRLTADVRERARTAIAELDRRLAIGDAAKVAATRRVLEEERALEVLRARCAVADGDVSISQALVDDIVLFGKLVGDDNTDYKRWHLRIVDYVDLRRRLAVLDRAEALPQGVDKDLAAFARIVGEDDSNVKGWRNKVERVRALSLKMAPLSTIAPLPADAEAGVAELKELLGEFAEHPAWLKKIERVRQLLASCARDFGPDAVILAEGAGERLDLLRGEVGTTSEIQTWQERSVILAGPGRPGWASAYTVDAMGPRAAWTLPGESGLVLQFRHVPPGEVWIGSTDEEPGHEADEQRFRVRLSRGRWIAETETSQAVWAAITGTWPSSERDPQRPVERVSWQDVQGFLGTLRERAPGLAVRLPTEAEWEHACRAGGADPAYAAGDPEALLRRAWFRSTSGDRSQQSGRRGTNALGLSDMLGNVWEWCEDRYGSYPIDAATDPIGIERDTHVARGGSWSDRATLVRAANRVELQPGLRSAILGFRLLIEADATKP